MSSSFLCSKLLTLLSLLSLSLVLIVTISVVGLDLPLQRTMTTVAFAQIFSPPQTNNNVMNNNSTNTTTSSASNTQQDYVTWYNKGIDLLNAGKYTEALAAFNNAISVDPNQARVWHNKGVALDKIGRYSEAVDSYNKAINIEPNNARHWNSKGTTLYHLERYQEALDSYNKALSIDPSNPQFQKNRDLTQNKIRSSAATNPVTNNVTNTTAGNSTSAAPAGGNMTSAGGGNMTSAGGGNMTSAGGGNLTESTSNLTSQPPSSLSAAMNSSTRLQDSFKRAENSVVQITSKITNPNVIIVNGKLLDGNNTLLGSGFIYDVKGHIVTSAHVVPDTSNSTNKVVDVAFSRGNTYQAKVIGRDPFSDIAVLQLIGNFSDERFVPLSITNSSNLQVGQQVIAIGNPFGLSGVMTTGIITNTARLLPNPDIGFSLPNVIQTDAPFSPGDAGGPLLNMQGHVIGMNNIGLYSNETFSGIAFAVPSNTISHIVPVLIQTGSYAHPWLGISGSSITPEISQSTGIPENYKGVIVDSVNPGSPAEKASLRGISHNSNMTQLGDIIIAIDGHSVKRFEDILSYLEINKSVGDSVKITVNRDGQIVYRTAILQAMPQLPPLLP